MEEQKLKENDILKICEMFKQKCNIKEIAEKFNVSKGAILGIKRRKNWTYLTQNIEW